MNVWAQHVLYSASASRNRSRHCRIEPLVQRCNHPCLHLCRLKMFDGRSQQCHPVVALLLCKQYRALQAVQPVIPGLARRGRLKRPRVQANRKLRGHCDAAEFEFGDRK